jgi:hypothetical protein
MDARTMGIGVKVIAEQHGASVERHVELPGNGVELPVACFGCETQHLLEIWFSPMKPRATIRNGWTVRPKQPEGVENLHSVLLEVLCPACSGARQAAPLLAAAEEPHQREQ